MTIIETFGALIYKFRELSWNSQIPVYVVIGVVIYILRNTDYSNKKSIKRLSLTLLIILFVLGGLTIYVQKFMPHGEYIATGYHDDRGREVYVEDMRELNIPDWAKFIRGNNSAIIIILFGIGLAGFGLLDKAKGE